MTSYNGFDIYDDFDIDVFGDKLYEITRVDEKGNVISITNHKLIIEDIKRILRVVRTDGVLRYIYKDICSNPKGDACHRVLLRESKALKDVLETVILNGAPNVKIGGKMKRASVWTYVQANIQP